MVIMARMNAKEAHLSFAQDWSYLGSQSLAGFVGRLIADYDQSLARDNYEDCALIHSRFCVN